MKNNLSVLRNEKLKNAKKALGQNFLIDPAIVSRISSYLQFNDNVVEIGPGVAFLTESVLQKNPKSLFAVEKDTALAPILDELKQDYVNFSYKFDDAMNINWEDFDYDYSLISNLPYNISAPLSVNFCYQNARIREMVLMYQKEMGQRIAATEGADYGRISVIMQAQFKVKKVMDLKAGSYIPAPKVDSQVLHFTPRVDKLSVEQLKKLDKLIKIAFENRRKKVLSNLKKHYENIEEIFQKLSISDDVRAEEISVEEYKKIIKKFL